MTTAAARLVFLSGLPGGTAATHLLAIKLSGTDAGSMLVSRSGLVTGTAAEHLLADSTTPVGPGSTGGSGGGAAPRLKARKEFKEFFDRVLTPKPLLSVFDRRELQAEIEGTRATLTTSPIEEDDEEIAAIMLLLL